MMMKTTKTEKTTQPCAQCGKRNAVCNVFADKWYCMDCTTLITNRFEEIERDYHEQRRNGWMS